jgi:hypothetical protein
LEAFDSAGLWWLPDDPTEQVVGLLRFSAADGFRLSIPFGNLGGLKNMAARVNHPEPASLVHGVLRNGKHVTLTNVLMTNMTMSMPGASTEEYYSNAGLVGVEQPAANPEVERIKLRYTHLRDWVGNHPCSSTHSFEGDRWGRSVDYHYETPEPEELASGDGWTLAILHFATVPTASVTGFNLTHDCELELRFDNPLSLEAAMARFVNPVWQFLVFCLDRDVDTLSLRIKPEATDDWVDVGHHQFVCGTDGKILTEPFMMLSRRQLGDRSAAVLSTWMSLSEDERRAVSLLTGLVGERTGSSDLRFLVAAQGLEALSRVDAREFELEPIEFERRASAVLESVADAKLQKWLKRKLRSYLNERSANELLRDLMDDIGPYVEKLAPSRRSLLADIRSNRNFYTHRDARRASRVLDGEQLYILTQAVILLLKAAILRRVGFTREEALSIMEENQGALQWRIKTARQYSADVLA